MEDNVLGVSGEERIELQAVSSKADWGNAKRSFVAKLQCILLTVGTDISGSIWGKSRIWQTSQQTSQQFVLLSLNLKINYC